MNLRLNILSSGFTAPNCLWSQCLRKRSRCQKYLKLLQNMSYYLLHDFYLLFFYLYDVTSIPTFGLFLVQRGNSWPKLTTSTYNDLNLNWINYHMFCLLWTFMDDIFLNSFSSGIHINIRILWLSGGRQSI